MAFVVDGWFKVLKTPVDTCRSSHVLEGVSVRRQGAKPDRERDR